MSSDERFPVSLLDIVPPGCIVAHAISGGAPPGYLPCDGSSHSSNDYPELFSVISYTFGGSAGIFRLPDIRDRFVRGFSSNRAVGSTQDDRIKVHDHELTSDGNKAVNDNFKTLGFKSVDENDGGDLVNKPSTSGFNLSFDSTSDEFASEMRPKNMAFSFAIKF